MLTESSGETLNRFVARHDKSDLDGAFRAWSRVPRRPGVQPNNESVPSLHGGPVVPEAVGELEAEDLGVEPNRAVHVGDVDGRVSAVDHGDNSPGERYCVAPAKILDI